RRWRHRLTTGRRRRPPRPPTPMVASHEAAFNLRRARRSRDLRAVVSRPHDLGSVARVPGRAVRPTIDSDQLATFQQCTGRTAPPSGPFYEAWLICGRRAGKSFTLAMIAMFLSCFKDWSEFLQPGETGRIVIVAADRKQGRVIFGYVLGFLKNIPMLDG